MPSLLLTEHSDSYLQSKWKLKKNRILFFAKHSSVVNNKFILWGSRFDSSSGFVFFVIEFVLFDIELYRHITCFPQITRFPLFTPHKKPIFYNNFFKIYFEPKIWLKIDFFGGKNAKYHHHNSNGLLYVKIKLDLVALSQSAAILKSVFRESLYSEISNK